MIFFISVNINYEKSDTISKVPRKPSKLSKSLPYQIIRLDMKLSQHGGTVICSIPQITIDNKQNKDVIYKFGS